jgi:hypothetical protein
MHNFYELIWDSELCCGNDDLEVVWYLFKCRYGEEEIMSLRERILEFKKCDISEADLVVQVWRSCVKEIVKVFGLPEGICNTSCPLILGTLFKLRMNSCRFGNV